VAEQGASNGAGQAAGKSFVSFSRNAAQRIAKAVRTVEAGDRNQPGLTFEHPIQSSNARGVRIATFSGSWNIGTINTVTFKHAPTATASVTNLFWPITATSYVDENCAVAKDGTAWFLITPQLEVTSASSSFSYVYDISVAATLNTSSCSVTVGKTLYTSSASISTQFLRIHTP